MYKIAIIGAGQLGSRHLQGIAQSNFDITIEVVEPFEASRKVAEERYEEILDTTHVKKIDFFDNISLLSDELDLVVVATSSDVRSAVIKELLSLKKVENLVLEKVLFQTISEYEEIEELLFKTNTSCWVNHPRRMYPFYQKLQKELSKANQISYNVQGGDWGLGCNGLHFLDHLSFLVDSSDIKIEHQALDNILYESKRKGFIEFGGLLSGRIGKHSFSFHTLQYNSVEILTIVSDVMALKINETEGIIEVARASEDWVWKTIEEKIVYYQSELSQRIIEDILVKNVTSLPTYKEAKALHIPFLTALLAKMEEITGETSERCPIT